ncbi:glycosyltransferase family 2 protein [Hydrogenophaga sp. PBL-H3]|uniref:glycosyltransferase family 2 protein n=1 Tax=Hydrogenophaga sp. PBL-H3 TaxID=434010 RepID=UPI00132013D3|nr:glycosyltransferase family 2 protein [Hydrogenophaga sp. PBL-H3]QHE75918.1 glycosyltransferase family 2 protein [Hydrogenophaga sp. PBL-H3]QHE80342.1 glycosyltransferase family 2 protein [Hydrogenophaga sp. PBL-H3]
MIPISVLILTRNEQQDLPGCLESVAWSDDVQVLDSFSTDATVSIAEAAGARVTQRAFDGYASQRNAGLRMPFKHAWVLTVDADERVPAALQQEMHAFVAAAEPHVAAARMRRRDIWWGVWLRRSQISPLYVRLVRPDRVHYEREINEVLVADGPIADLRQPFDHYPFSKGLDHWLSKHNTYSRMEAELILSRSIAKPSWRTALVGSDFNERRVHQKAIFYRLPARPLIKLVYMLVWRRGLLDGVAGIRYAILQSIYEYMIVLKVKERELQLAQGATTAAPQQP